MKKQISISLLSFILAICCIGEHAFAKGSINTLPCVETVDISNYAPEEEGILSKSHTDVSYQCGRQQSCHKQQGIRLAPLPGSSGLTPNCNKSVGNNNENIRNAADLLMVTWDSFKTKCDLSKYHISYQQFKDLIPSLLNRYPRYFYLDGSYTYYQNSDGCISDVICNFKYDKAQIKTMVSDYDTAVGKILEEVSPSWSDLEKALYFNDYLTSHCEYDTTYSKYSAYDALVDRKAVCQGYSLAYMELLSHVGIPCKVVSSASLDHAWNMVYINNHYYYVDVTWNDPLGNYQGRAGHTFFLKSEAYFRSQEGKHLVDDDWVVDGGWDIHDADDSSYDNYFWNTMDTAFYYIDGFWYAFDGKEHIKKYSCHNGNFDAVEDVVVIDDIWYVIGKNNSFWTEKYVGTGKYGNAFYYSSPDKIYRLDVNTREANIIYELSTEEKSSGNIWSIYIDPDGKLYYFRSGKPWELAKQELALQLEKTINNQTNQITCYQIQFNGNGADSGNMDSIDNCFYGQTYSLGKNAFVYNHYEFAGWNTKPDGTGVPYGDNADIKNLTNQNYGVVTLYAQWKSQKELSAQGNNAQKTKLSYTSLKLKKGKSAKLELLNNTEKVSWKITSGKKCISLKNKSNKSVTVKGGKKGVAKVQALVGNKKYVCTVKVL